ncbi:MAG: DDE-type integrase/transposase/recombinase [Chloroflexi bacterium]|nr:DDE-type integrase/transposase/recombinase [Chloroflexota bacterium]
MLIDRVFELNEHLMALLQAGEGLTPQLTLDAESLKQALNAPSTPPKKALPYAYRLQQAIFGQWKEIDDGSVRCPHCGSDLVSQKENTPRGKKYRDTETGEWRQVEGYRYYCHNLDCEYQTFTNYPDEVRLYSSQTVDTVIWGVMVYMRMRTTYRLAAEAVGTSHVTLWRWAMAVGEQSLPVATLFGVVRSSGVVGVDEKWVLVPKNDKPAGKRKRWMYVYMAVDIHTYDLLHIDIYLYNGKTQALAFLQALKAKGYNPRVILTDMCQDYNEPIRTVFPKAKHHECVFHALQWAQRLVKDVYGNDYAKTHPEAVTLKERIYVIFKAKSKKTVHKRYRQVMALKEKYVALMPESQRIFDFLDRHYPKLVNAIENPLIPLTNNTVELVNRRFDQHYQNMCGFDGIDTARKYLHLFELTYRFTPFAKDNRPVEGRELDIRGKCPLELAGYDITHMPIARVVRGQLLGWPPEALRGLVPNT